MKALPVHTLYLGNKEGARWLPSDIAYVLEHTRRWFKFATILEATGIYRGVVAPTLLVKIASPDTEKVINLAANLGVIFGQGTVALEVGGLMKIIHVSDIDVLRVDGEFNMNSSSV